LVLKREILSIQLGTGKEDKKEFSGDIKEIYNTPTKKLTKEFQIALQKKWNNKYSFAMKSCQ